MSRSWVYFDSSSFVKLFTNESGSQEARRIARKSRMLINCITAVECISALSRKKAKQEIQDSAFETIVESIRTSLAQVDQLGLNDDVLYRAEAVVIATPLRTLDALHLASVLEFQSQTGIRLLMVTSDRKQEAAAKMQGIRTQLIE